MLRLLVIASIWATAYGGKQDRSFAQISIDGPVDAQPNKGSALDQEIQALDELIKAQQKKLAALGALRKAGTAPPDDVKTKVAVITPEMLGTFVDADADGKKTFKKEKLDGSDDAVRCLRPL